MKKLIAAIGGLFINIVAYGQGQILFNTHIDNVAARIFLVDGIPSTSGNIELGILSNGSFIPMIPEIPPVFGTTPDTAGYINAGVATAPAGFGDGAVVNLVLRAWLGTGPYGTTFNSGSTELDGVTLHTGINPPGLLVNNAGIAMQGFSVVPEPTTLALGAIGVGVLLVLRRKA